MQPCHLSEIHLEMGACSQGLLTQQSAPATLLIEMYPDLLNAAEDPPLQGGEQYGYPGGARGLLQHLHAQGYTDISHAG